MSVENKTGSGEALASEDELVYYPLPDLLPPDQVLVLNKRLGVLSRLGPATVTTWPVLLAQEQFSINEIRVLAPLLAHYPDYCPYEVMWSSFNTGQITDDMVQRARLRLQEAQFAGVWDHEMRPVRNILSRARFKLREFRIDVRSIVETGYLLKGLPEKDLSKNM